MPSSEFRSTVVSLWFRLITLCIFGLTFAEALKLAQGQVQGWSYYLETSGIVLEVVVRLVFAALAGVVAGSICTALVAPSLWQFKAKRARIAAWTINVVTILVLFFDSRFALAMLMKSWGPSFSSSVVNAILAAHLVVFAAILWIRRSRQYVLNSVDGALSDKMTRRTAIATIAGTAGLVATEFALSKKASVVKAALRAERPKSNVLLITFDALSAEDMSVYGYRLPTTPNIDAFAGTSSVFTNFYSTSTFTTPGIASLLTGTYPSQNRVYHIIGRIRPEDANRSLPYLMRGAGYATGAFFSNPYAYYLAGSIRNAYDFLPEPVFQSGGLQHLWGGTRPLHQDTEIGNRMDEYNDLSILWNTLGRLPADLFRRYPAAETFAHARQLVSQLPDGFFLWVHVMTPHSPYHPAQEDRGRFIPEEELRTFEDEGDDGARRWFPHYEPDQQSQVDQRRLAYDEFLLSADREFGSFMNELEKNGKLSKTTVIVSADHGESFEGGIYQHEHQYMTRPEIHIPLIIRTPGQQQGRKISFTADQTALAPTILELAGQPKPAWMPGESLVRLLKDEAPVGSQGLAFCQYFENSSVFKPPQRGTVGVIDGEYQLVVILGNQNGLLRPLDQAQFWKINLTQQNPERAQALRAAIHSRFPDLVQPA
jgi:arylsulfatase A-like enzyme